ncbi:hypothetical protein ACWEGQ_29105 [Streptomyces seoulensis]
MLGRHPPPAEQPFLAAANPTPISPIGAVMLVVINLICGSIGFWHTRRMKKGKKYMPNSHRS